MVGDDTRAAREGLALRLIDRKTDELHGADAIGVELPPIEVGLRRAGALELDAEVILEADKIAQMDRARVLVAKLEHQRRGKLIRRRQQIAVRLDLMLHLGILRDALGAQHLENLIANGLAILE